MKKETPTDPLPPSYRPDVHLNNEMPLKEIRLIAKGAGIFFTGSLIGTVLKYLFELMVARSLGVALYGSFIIGFSLFKILELAAALGIQNGILRFGALHKSNNDQSKTKGAIISALKIVTITSCSISIVLILFSKSIAENIFNNAGLVDIFIFMGLSLPFSVFSLILVFALQSFKVVKYRVLVKEITEPLTRIVLFLAFFALGWKLWGALSSFLTSCILGMGMALFYLIKTYPQILDTQIKPILEIKRLLLFSWPLSLAGFLNRMLLWIGPLFTGYFLHESDTGIFGSAQRTAMLGIIVLNSFEAIFAPIIADLHSKKKFHTLESLFKAVSKWIFTLSFPLFLVMIFYPSNILRFFGRGFDLGAKCLVILGIGQLIHSLTGPYGYMILMSGRSMIILMNAIIASGSNILLCLFLIPKYGILGAALAVAISMSIVGIIGIIEVIHIYKMHPYRMDYLKPLLSGGIATAISVFLTKSHLTPNDHLFTTIIGVSTLFSLYIVFLLLFRLSKEEQLVISEIELNLTGSKNKKKKG